MRKLLLLFAILLTCMTSYGYDSVNSTLKCGESEDECIYVSATPIGSFSYVRITNHTGKNLLGLFISVSAENLMIWSDGQEEWRDVSFINENITFATPIAPGEIYEFKTPVRQKDMYYTSILRNAAVQVERPVFPD